jgi:phosphoglycolate phosphatase-like HAD superfamily hydrolase
MNIYLDLDGTLLDVSERFYKIYCDLLDKFNCDNKLNKETYWQLKKERCIEEEIVHRTCRCISSKEYSDLLQNVIES